ncbi:hypothetical protein C0995_008519 [Termitomyces sp. Mi166|nr:hypothetical protein C0995_008519 [Termitomyces sp. Mi166\
MSENAQTQALLASWRSACAKFEITSRASTVQLVTTLEHITQALAQDEEARAALGTHASLWTDLRKLWRDLTRAQLTFWDVDDEETNQLSNKDQDLRTVCGSLAKFTRNLVAGVPENQVRAYENEPDMRRLLHYHTSWSAMEADTECSPAVSVSRVLTEAISNMVTTNEALMSKLWETYLNLPEDQVVLIRLLASPDPRTVLTVLIFILNCIHGSRLRSTMLTRTAVGARVCVTLLDDMLKLYEAEEPSVGAQAFDVGYDIMTQLIEQGLVPDLYGKFTISEEIVTPHQTTLLKIVDSYLQSNQTRSLASEPLTIKIHQKLSPMLAKCFLDLSAYARKAVERSIRSPNHSSRSPSSADVSSDDSSTPEFLPPVELDAMLPKVCEALVLVTQCIITITLEAEGENGENVNESRDDVLEPGLKTFFLETHSNDGGIVENLIGKFPSTQSDRQFVYFSGLPRDLLRLLDVFLPRINFGKPVHFNSSGGRDTQATPTPTQEESTSDPTGFQYLKRDLVRLLGILCHGVKAVQDLVRTCGGIPVVMNLCVIDERNPCVCHEELTTNEDLREHAIFALHCLLKDNRENQAIVDAIQSPDERDKAGSS